MNDSKKISIITVVYNNVSTIAHAIESVRSQTYPNIEYIIIDGKSTDGTIELIQNYANSISQFISEPDQGIYDAMNKGIQLSTGDIIGILNSDDFYYDETVIQNIMTTFETYKVDSVFADLIYVKPSNLNEIIRYYDSSHFSPKKFKYGWMPAHPTFFVKRSVYEKYGIFNTAYKIAADYELLTRFLAKYRITYHYIKKPLVIMRLGGVSTRNLKSNFILNREIIRACKENGINTNWFMVLSKYPKKILGLFKR